MVAQNSAGSSSANQSCESEAHLADEEEIQDHGENSTTLSSIEHTQRQLEPAPDIQHSQYQRNFECPDEDFKELLDNLDIQNIEIKNRFGMQPKNDEEQEDKSRAEADEKFSIEIEKLLSDDNEGEHRQD